MRNANTTVQSQLTLKEKAPQGATTVPRDNVYRSASFRRLRSTYVNRVDIWSESEKFVERHNKTPKIRAIFCHFLEILNLHLTYW